MKLKRTMNYKGLEIFIIERDDKKMMDTERSIILIAKLLDIENIKLVSYDIIFLNLNSVFSTMFYGDMLDEFIESDKLNDYFQKVSEIIKSKIMLLSRQRLIILYNLEEDTYVDIFPGWKKKRYEARKRNKFAEGIFKHFVTIFIKLSNNSPFLETVDTSNFNPALIPYVHREVRELHDKKTLIISRDMLDYLNVEIGINLFDGLGLFTKKNFQSHTVGKIPKIDPMYLKYYYRIRGIIKYDYIGVRGLGEKRAIKYIEENKIALVNGKDEYCDDELYIFDFHKYVFDYLEKENKEKFNKLIEIVHDINFEFKTEEE